MEPQKDKGPAKDIDDVLSEFGLGKYQIYNLLLIGLITSFSSISPISFSLTAGDLNYRCRIGECDDVNNAPYYEKWIENAIPKEKAQFSKCHRYNSHYYNSTINITTSLLQCPYKFHKLEITKCDSWIYETKERTILSDFDDVKCEENKWKLTSIGMMNNIGQFIGVPICGLLCDRFGRKTMMVVNIGLSSIFGIIKAFSISYIMFISFELLESLLSSGIYTTAFILGLELVTPEYRALAGTIIGTFYPLGEVMFGVVAWYFLNWRTDILVCYIPSLLFISYWWLVPESVRWLQMNGNNEEVIKTLKKIAKENKKEFLENVKELKVFQEPEFKSPGLREALKASLRSKVILKRIFICSFCWFANMMVYYGLSFNSVELAGNKFLNFIIVNLVEIPAFVFSGYLMKILKRRPCQGFSFILSGLGCIACQLVSSDAIIQKSVLYMMSKFWITAALNVLYVFSAEIFPTELRMSLVGLCSMFGRLGSMVAPQTPLLRSYVGEDVPVYLFGTISIIAGLLSSMFPETFKQKLSDTIYQTNT